MQPAYEGITQFCARVGVGRTHCYHLLSEGKLIARKVGRRTLVDVKHGLEYFQNAPIARLNCLPKQKAA